MNIPDYNPNHRVVILSIGLPASGKTTWAKSLVVSDPKRWKRVNRDDLRAMVHADKHEFTADYEKAITAASDAMVKAFLLERYDVILDNTHLNAKDRNAIHTLASSVCSCTVYQDVFVVPLKTILERNAARQGVARVPDSVILSMAKKAHVNDAGYFKHLRDDFFVYEKPEAKVVEQDESLPPAIICDLDGTLCLFDHHRSPYDSGKCEGDLPNKAVLNILENSYNGNYDTESSIIFMSGRSDEFRPQTEKWLWDNLPSNITFDLYMREAGDRRKDSIVKQELYETHVQGKFYVRFVLDDRCSVVSLWRSLGLTCLQVAPGNF